MQEVETFEEFRQLSGEDVEAALAADLDASNLVALEVYRLVDGYAREYAVATQHIGYIPAYVMNTRSQTAIEAIALRLTLEAIQNRLGRWRR